MELLKLHFAKDRNGVWAIQSFIPVSLKPQKAKDESFFVVADDLVVAQPAFVGTTKFVLGQSIVPIIAHVPGEGVLRCIGTGFFISCTGLLITAAHVITDPIERRYGGVRELDDQTWHLGELKLGVMIPLNPVFQGDGYIFRDIQWAAFLAERTEHPLPIDGISLKLTSDTAICKVSPIGKGIPHQPLAIVQSGLMGKGMVVGKSATAIGYGSMRDVELVKRAENIVSGEFCFDLHVSTGTILEQFPDNIATRLVSTPGACFSASFKLPAGMSGSPIFDDERIYVHGVVSKGLVDQGGLANLGFGSMLAHSLALPIKPLDNRTLLDLHKSDDHGFPKLKGPDL